MKKQIKNLVKMFAPRFSRRRLFLSIIRDSINRPSSIAGRLASVNFFNNRICKDLQILCTVCGQVGSMAYEFPDIRLRSDHRIGLLRETLCCKSCGATMRDRQLAHGLLDFINRRTHVLYDSLKRYRESGGHKLRILDSDSFSPLNRVLRGMDGYVHTQYVSNREIGAVLGDGSIVMDLQNIHFHEESFDVVLSSDVMEHVFDDQSAHRSIYRCLVPHGEYIFTVPFDPTYSGCRHLTVPIGGTAYFILDRQIHGDPHSADGVIAHRVYGWHLVDDLNRLGFTTRFEEIYRPQNGIFRGDLFIAMKRPV